MKNETTNDTADKSAKARLEPGARKTKVEALASFAGCVEARGYVWRGHEWREFAVVGGFAWVQISADDPDELRREAFDASTFGEFYFVPTADESAKLAEEHGGSVMANAELIAKAPEMIALIEKQDEHISAQGKTLAEMLDTLTECEVKRTTAEIQRDELAAALRIIHEATSSIDVRQVCRAALAKLESEAAQ